MRPVQNRQVMRPDVRPAFDAALPLVPADDPAFAVRFERFFTELYDPLARLYGADERFPGAWEALLSALGAAAAARPPKLRALDHEREVTPDWLQREQVVGYATYVDRFAGTLDGVRRRIGYLRELGVTYLHLLPLLHSRPAPNDGGYAVMDYGAVEPRAWARWTTCARWPTSCAGTGWRCASTSWSTTPRASTRGRRRHWPGTNGRSASTARSPIAASRMRSRRR